MKKYLASAPSNIAVIKYMGKTDRLQNNPTNASLSLTLESLRTYVELRPKEGAELASGLDEWQALTSIESGEKLLELKLSEKSQERFLKHLGFLKKHWGIEIPFTVQSANNFPSDCGLASSASSFAALTLAFRQFLLADSLASARAQSRDLNADLKTSLKRDLKDLRIEEWAQLSRKGSGSSCRSFLGPWVEWREDGSILSHEFQMEPLLHSVIIVEAEKKLVSSSEAHRRVVSSPFFLGRAERANRRLEELLSLWKIQKSGNEASIWNRSFAIIWDEFIDMHQLFETCEDPFKYMNTGTHRCLSYLEKFWQLEGTGPLVTMDAGANIHLIFKKSQEWMRQKIEKDLLGVNLFHSEMIQ